jgi:hypothetical protein
MDTKYLESKEQAKEQEGSQSTSTIIRIKSGDGQIHSILRSCLEESDYFQAMLSARWNKGTEFLEVICSSESFTNILNVLRYGQESVFDLTNSQKFMLLCDADYLGLPAQMFSKIKYISPEEAALPPIKPYAIKVNRGKTLEGELAKKSERIHFDYGNNRKYRMN